MKSKIGKIITSSLLAVSMIASALPLSVSAVTKSGNTNEGDSEKPKEDSINAMLNTVNYNKINGWQVNKETPGVSTIVGDKEPTSVGNKAALDKELKKGGKASNFKYININKNIDYESNDLTIPNYTILLVNKVTLSNVKSITLGNHVLLTGLSTNVTSSKITGLSGGISLNTCTAINNLNITNDTNITAKNINNIFIGGVSNDNKLNYTFTSVTNVKFTKNANIYNFTSNKSKNIRFDSVTIGGNVNITGTNNTDDCGIRFLDTTISGKTTLETTRNFTILSCVFGKTVKISDCSVFLFSQSGSQLNRPYVNVFNQGLDIYNSRNFLLKNSQIKAPSNRDGIPVNGCAGLNIKNNTTNNYKYFTMSNVHVNAVYIYNMQNFTIKRNCLSNKTYKLSNCKYYKNYLKISK